MRRNVHLKSQSLGWMSNGFPEQEGGFIIKELLYKLSKIENTRLIGVNAEQDIHIEIFVPQAIEGIQNDVNMNEIVKKISNIIDDEISQKYSIKVKDGFISIIINISKKSSFHY